MLRLKKNEMAAFVLVFLCVDLIERAQPLHAYVTYMCILVKKVKSVQINSQDAWGMDGGRA